MTFWEDWAQSAKDRDRVPPGTAARHGILYPMVIMRVASWRPTEARVGAVLEAERVAPARWAVAWRPPWLVGRPRLLAFRILSFVSTN